MVGSACQRLIRDRQEFGKGAGTIHADALRVRAKMTAAGETIAAMSAGDVTFPRNEIAWRKTFHVIADVFDHADKLVADDHRNRDRFLRPRVPVVNVNVGPADRCFLDPNEHIVAFDFRDRNFLEPQSGLGFALHDRLHRFLHGRN